MTDRFLLKAYRKFKGISGELWRHTAARANALTGRSGAGLPELKGNVIAHMNRGGLRAVAGLAAVVVTLAAVSPLPAADPADQAWATMLTAYQHLRAHHLQPQPPDVLMRAAIRGIHRILKDRLPNSTSSWKTPDAPNLLRPLDSLVPTGDEGADLRAFREHFYWTTYLASRYASPAALAQAGVRGMSAVYDDPYTVLMSPGEFKRFQARARGGPYAGVGVTLVFERTGPVIRGLVPDGPAWRAGLRVGDVIVRIDGRPTSNLGEEGVISALRGTAQTVVTVEVRRPGAGTPISRQIVRGVIVEQPVVASMLDDAVGYLRLDYFTEATAQSALGALTDLSRRGARALVLDLRGNGGGSVLASILLASGLLDSGNVVVAVGRNGRQVPYPVLPHTVRFVGPIAILVDGDTASAAEILAGALQDAGAPLIGQSTFGKALIQSILALPDGSALRYTSARYLTPAGRDLGKRGLSPDILVRESGDEALRRALDWLRTKLQSGLSQAA